MTRHTKAEVEKAIRVLQEEPGVRILGMTIQEIASLAIKHADERHKGQLDEAKAILDGGYSVQARYRDNPRRWFNCGNVSHVEAARFLCSNQAQPPGVYEVETRVRDNPEVIFPHTVKVALTIDVTPHRGD